MLIGWIVLNCVIPNVSMKLVFFKAYLIVALISVGIVIRSEADVEQFESLKVMEMNLPGFPEKVTFEGIYEGVARLIIKVDQTGRLVDAYQESYTHPEFGRLAEKYVRLWRFQPAKLNGEPITVIKEVDFHFDDKRGVYSTDIHGATALKLNFFRFASSKKTYSPAELDQPLESVEMEQPLFPFEFKNRGVKGTATVVFFIDEMGMSRIPNVTDYSHVAFGQAASMAVENWKFKPPTVGGKPVSVKVRQVFTFSDS